MFAFFFRFGRWKITHYLSPEIKKCVVIAAPHTSNWDAIYGIAASRIMKLNFRFAIKKEWVRFPLKRIMLSCGALPIDRNKTTAKTNTVASAARLFEEHDELKLIITPEGTRSKVTKWKTGFYFIALHAKVPIALAFMDYKKRECGIDKIIYPSGNLEADMKIIMDFYKNVQPKNLQNFSLDTTFA